MSYRLLMLSTIPVYWDGHIHRTMDLWAVDLAGQLRHTRGLQLICPVVETPPPGWTGMAPLPEGVDVVSLASASAECIDRALRTVDLVQVHGGGGWFESWLGRQLVTKARKLGVKSIVGLSSNRARTALMNSLRPRSFQGLIRLVKGVVKYFSINLTYRSLTSRADGTFIVGEGLRPLVSDHCRSLHVGTASWVQQADLNVARGRTGRDDVRRLRQICIASRLERMKGVHMGVDALALLKASQPLEFTVSIFGAGPERAALERQVDAADMAGIIHFQGTRAYPKPFFDALGTHGLVLLTNLNDEQPRLIFDAISQRTLPMCPDSPAYQSLGLPQRLRYEAGNSQSLAHAVAEIWECSERELEACWSQLFDMAERFTLDSMHARRSEWIRTHVLGKSMLDLVGQCSRD